MRFPLHCSPCAVCGLPATHMDIGREVVHGTARKARRCPLPNPPRPIEIKESA